MALQKPMDFGNGVTTTSAYIEVSNIFIDFENNSGHITVKTWLNKDTHDNGLLTIINPETIWFNNTQPMLDNSNTNTVTSNIFTDFFATGDAKENAYAYLKTLPNYSTCIDVPIIK